ncbi:MAG: hypothetical protein KTR31_24385 [Myxococcales bacterium]|nr:hypothetical protein [Myxococcales bacterium]
MDLVSLPDGGVVFVATVTGSVVLGSDSSAPREVLVETERSASAIVPRYGADGEVRWARTITGTQSLRARGTHFAVDLSTRSVFTASSRWFGTSGWLAFGDDGGLP